MNNNYKRNKFLFNKIIKKNYKLKRDKNDNTILLINTSDNIIKCKYIFFLVKYNEDNKIQWSDFNPFIDQKTRLQSSVIRKNLSNIYDDILDEKTQNISNKKFNNIIKDLIKNSNSFEKNHEKWNCDWILTNKYKDYTEYYMITNIIYF